MWVFTDEGMFSVVRDFNDRSLLWVRFRHKDEAEGVAERYFGGLEVNEIITLTNSDYPFRFSIDRVYFDRGMKKIIKWISYPNFKDHVATISRERAHRYCDVWALCKSKEDIV